MEAAITLTLLVLLVFIVLAAVFRGSVPNDMGVGSEIMGDEMGDPGSVENPGQGLDLSLESKFYRGSDPFE